MNTTNLIIDGDLSENRNSSNAGYGPRSLAHLQGAPPGFAHRRASHYFSAYGLKPQAQSVEPFGARNLVIFAPPSVPVRVTTVAPSRILRITKQRLNPQIL
jgi:hypothetical protein